MSQETLPTNPDAAAAFEAQAAARYASSREFMDKRSHELSARENGQATLITDPAEAYEVAHGTKELEEKTTAAVGNYALASYHNDEAGVRQHGPAAIASRTEADAAANQISEAYKNGAAEK
jgi:hypothetical protein